MRHDRDNIVENVRVLRKTLEKPDYKLTPDEIAAASIALGELITQALCDLNHIADAQAKLASDDRA
jgi:hypothetical protein